MAAQRRRAGCQLRGGDAGNREGSPGAAHGPKVRARPETDGKLKVPSKRGRPSGTPGPEGGSGEVLEISPEKGAPGGARLGPTWVGWGPCPARVLLQLSP